jgi:hypothetical protein
MSQIKQDLKDEAALLEKFGANPDFDLPDNYGKQASYHGNGRYPPDWNERRSAVWWLQDDQCGRCGRDTRNGGHVHHIKFLSDGGTNRLENLVGLCTDCHALIHPKNNDLDGDWADAPKFPTEGAQDEVAVIRRDRPSTSRDGMTAKERDFGKLEAETPSRNNTHSSQSAAVYDIPPSITRRFSEVDASSSDSQSVVEELNNLLLLRNRIPENEAHNTRRLEIETSQSGVLGWLSPFSPDIDIEVSETKETTGPVDRVRERVGSEDSSATEIIFSENVTEARVEVTEGDGNISKKQVAFDDNSSTQSVSVSVSPPPLSVSTIGSYAWNFGQKSLLIPILYGLLGLALVPTAGVVLLFSVFGILAGAVGLVGWSIIAIFFDGSWSMVGQMAAAIVLSFITGSIAIMVLEFFGINIGE